MVLQQKIKAPVWGKATPAGKVTVEFQEQKKATVADENGDWMIRFEPLTAGGPFTLKISGKDTIFLSNVMVGEVWICSGQSNMEWGVNNSNNAREEIMAADFPSMRLFHVNHTTSLNKKEDVDAAGWKVCSPASVPSFSAVAYFFGRHLHQELQLPIGLIHTSWGGTVAEAWTAADFLAQMEDFAPIIEALKTSAASEEELRADYDRKMREWKENVDAKVKAQSGGISWQNVDCDDSAWEKMSLPVLWEGAGLPGFDGIVWFRKTIEIADDAANEGFTLSLGPIDDQDITYINGQQIGTTDLYNAPREYTIPAGTLKAGANVIAIQVLDTGGGGGIWGDASQMWLKSESGAVVQLSGEWKYNIGVSLRDVPPRPPTPDNPNYPTVLYNAMLEPLMPFAIRGAIWYQGEGNAGRAYQYRELFPTMITSWRTNWGQGDFPFLFVQLANFRQVLDHPAESDWAELREAQTKTLSLPNTGMAVIIDIGEADNIHPGNKQQVGRRLALNALARVYGQDIVYSGPLYKSMRLEGDKIRLNFDHVDGGLLARGGDLTGFAIAGQDSNFVWADAVIDGETIIVSSPNVANPLAVRYAWADNPICNLYNAEGLPASPFRTDDWAGVTKNAQ
ncbi:9-O-acetylesterase [candidate division KSB1 bacterium]|nr:9-O-acetylesterase [candidate division KSB1 bacterium]